MAGVIARGREALVIVDEFDKPTGRCFALYAEGSDHWRYVSAYHGGKPRAAVRPDRYTPVEDFGVVVELDVAGNTPYLVIRKTRDSVATYSDGVPRPWQGDDVERIRVNLAALQALIRMFSPELHSDRAEAA